MQPPQPPQAQMYRPQNPVHVPLAAAQSPPVISIHFKLTHALIIPAGLHIVFALGFIIYAFVLALFYMGDDVAGSTAFWWALSGSLSLTAAPASISGIVSAMSVYLALNNKSSKILAVSLTILSLFISIMLLALLTSSLHPGSFSDGWRDFFNYNFWETIIPQISSHIIICLGVVLLMALSKNEKASQL
mgnify:CR=1 FL=1